MESLQTSEENLYEAVIAVDEKRVRQLLDEGHSVEWRSKNGGTLLHEFLLQNSGDLLQKFSSRRQLIYMLRNAGLDVNYQDQKGRTPLHVLLTCVNGDPELLEALLQCGADMYIRDHMQVSPLNLIETQSGVPKATQELFKKYQPGLWRAVQQDDICAVRKLINLWCRVDLSKNGKTLKELALQKGTENIIRLVKDIEPSMHLAHSVLASDVKTLTELCNSGKSINTEFKNLGDMCVTPLFYAIMQNNVEIVKLLCKMGARHDAIIIFQDEEIPVYFAALNKDINLDIIKALTPKRDQDCSLTTLNYQGKHIVFHLIENGVNPSALKDIVQQGYPELLALRNQNNLCPRQLAERLRKKQYVSVIDEIVHDWYLDSDSNPRKTLALLGYPSIRTAEKHCVPAEDVVQSMETSSEQAQFDTHLESYQEQIQLLHEAVEEGDLESVKYFIEYTSASSICFHTCLVESLAVNDGQPLLHKAVLRKNVPVLEFLASTMTSLKINIDCVRDQFQRTALHYAYALPDGTDVVNTLLDHGASEFTMDKDNRSPEVFKDNRKHPDMNEFLEYHLYQEYDRPEPTSWLNKPRRVRFAQCPHHGNRFTQQRIAGAQAIMFSTNPINDTMYHPTYEDTPRQPDSSSCDIL